MDTFAEFYHAPILHAKQSPTKFPRPRQKAGFEAPHYQHRRAAPVGQHIGYPRTGRWMPRRVKPSKSSARAGFSARGTSPTSVRCPPGLNPAKCNPWGLDSFQLFPNFVILIWGRAGISPITTGRRRTTRTSSRATSISRRRRRPGNVRAGDGGGVVQGIRTAGRQHAGGDPDDGRARAVDTFLYNDQEVLLRHLHKETASWIDEYRRNTAGASAVTAMLPTEFADLEVFSEWCLPTEPQRYEAPRQFDGRDAGVLRRHHVRAEEAMSYCDKFPIDDLPDDVLNLMHLLYSMIMVSFPVECWKQPRVPTPGPPRWIATRACAVTAPTVLKAQRWADVDAGEVRSPAVIVVDDNRITAVNPAWAAAGFGNGGRSGRRDAVAGPDGHGAEPAHRRARRSRGLPLRCTACRTIRRTARCAAAVNARTTLDAGFTTVRNSGLMVKTGGYLLDVALQRAIDPGWIRDRVFPCCARGYALRRSPGPDRVPAHGSRNHAAVHRRRHRQRRGRRAGMRPLPDPARGETDQGVRFRRRDVAQHRARLPAVFGRRVRGDR